MGAVDSPAGGSTGHSLAEQLRGRRVYLDANVFIYALEGEASLKAQVLPLFTALDAGEIDGVTSELTLAEVQVAPYRASHTELADRYERLLLPRPNLDRIPVTPALWRAAARLRAQTKLRLPDAVHLATAEAEDCAFLVTGDKDLGKISTVPAVLIAEPSA